MKQPVRDASTEFRPAACSAPGWDSLENRRTALAILLLIIAGGLVLRTYGLYGRSMWFDESVSWRTIQFPFAEMIDRTVRDIHAPLFYVLLRLWDTLFGESIVSLRTFSLAFSALAMLGVYLFTVEAMAMGRSPGDGGAGSASRARWIGLVATALFAVSLFQVRYAWEIRMYSLGTALAMFSSWLLLRALTAQAATRFALAALYARGAWLCLHALQCAILALRAGVICTGLSFVWRATRRHGGAQGRPFPLVRLGIRGHGGGLVRLAPGVPGAKAARGRRLAS